MVCQGVIKGVDPELTEEELKELIEIPQGFSLVHIRRMQKRDKGNNVKPLESVVSMVTRYLSMLRFYR